LFSALSGTSSQQRSGKSPNTLWEIRHVNSGQISTELVAAPAVAATIASPKVVYLG
jgi:hypothetical protein